MTEVTKRHRKQAASSVDAGGAAVTAWIKSGRVGAKLDPDLPRIARALADTETAARVAVLLEIHELMRPGPERREAYAALMNVSFKYGAMAEVDGVCTIGDFSK
jgi:hypothetical protein